MAKPSNYPTAKWSCVEHDAGFLIVADVNGAAFAFHLTRDEFLHAHDPAWEFLRAIRSLSRAVSNLAKIQGDQCTRRELTKAGVQQCGSEYFGLFTYRCQDCSRAEIGRG